MPCLSDFYGVLNALQGTLREAALFVKSSESSLSIAVVKRGDDFVSVCSSSTMPVGKLLIQARKLAKSIV